jgi:hypothetical protein
MFVLHVGLCPELGARKDQILEVIDGVQGSVAAFARDIYQTHGRGVIVIAAQKMA